MFGLITFTALFALLVIGTWRRPAVALAAVLCMYGLKQWGQNTSAFLTEYRTVANFSVAAIVALGLARMYMNKESKDWGFSRPGLLGIALYSYAAMSLTWTPAFSQAIQQWALHLPYILIVAVLAPLLFSNDEDMKSAAKWTVIIGGAICFLALFAGEWGARGLRVSGDLYEMETNPLALASLGGTVAILALIATVVPMPKIFKLLCIPIALAGLAVILRSGSRGQLLAAALSTLIGWFIASRRHNIGALIGIAIGATLLTTAGLWIWDQMDVATARWSSDNASQDVTGRLSSGFALLAESLSNPATLLFGIGNSGAFYYIGGYPHVAVLEVIAEEGIIGTLLYVGILISGLQSAFALTALTGIRSHEDRGTLRFVTAALTALLIFEWILTLKQGTLLSSIYFIAYAAILGRLRIWSAANSFSAERRGGDSLPIYVRPFANLMR